MVLRLLVQLKLHLEQTEPLSQLFVLQLDVRKLVLQRLLLELCVLCFLLGVVVARLEFRILLFSNS